MDDLSVSKTVGVQPVSGGRVVDGVRVVIVVGGCGEERVEEFWRLDGEGCDVALETRVGVALVQWAGHAARVVRVEGLFK